mmetsp:Transcript_32792/g.110494  ORF Transcript_32792/g.110494 Transcript_32792/m.110494 type:complete len:230 (+) Transcript_32792:3199-3888(+)
MASESPRAQSARLEAKASASGRSGTPSQSTTSGEAATAATCARRCASSNAASAPQLWRYTFEERITWVRFRSTSGVTAVQTRSPSVLESASAMTLRRSSRILDEMEGPVNCRSVISTTVEQSVSFTESGQPFAPPTVTETATPVSPPTMATRPPLPRGRCVGLAPWYAHAPTHSKPTFDTVRLTVGSPFSAPSLAPSAPTTNFVQAAPLKVNATPASVTATSGIATDSP